MLTKTAKTHVLLAGDLARPATIPRARVAETGQKRFPIIQVQRVHFLRAPLQNLHVPAGGKAEDARDSVL